MPIRVYWVNNLPDVVCVEYVGVWNMTDFHHAFEDFRSMASTIPHKVNLIVDMRAMDHLPTGLLTAVRTNLSRRPANTGMIVVVGVHPLIVGFVQMVRQLPLVTANVQLAQCYEDAMSLIRAQRSDTPNPPNYDSLFGKSEVHFPEDSGLAQ